MFGQFGQFNFGSPEHGRFQSLIVVSGKHGNGNQTRNRKPESGIIDIENDGRKNINSVMFNK